MSDFATRLAEQQARIVAACARSRRDAASVRIVAVSKTHPATAILEASAAGVVDFGESYAQELAPKVVELQALDATVASQIHWHFIGRLQSNKVRGIANVCVWLHGVDRSSLLDALAGCGANVRYCLQVNVSGEAQKGGCEPTSLDALVDHAVRLSESGGPRLVGLMTVPPASDEPEDARPYFEQLAALHAAQRARLSTMGTSLVDGFQHLSMGMSDDLEVAVEAGATLVRIGTALFGARPSSLPSTL